MLTCQKDLFDLPGDVVYLNGAYMSPSLRAVSAAGLEGIRMKERPFQITIRDFFQPVEDLKAAFARLLHVDEPQRIAVIPSVSYGIANAARNLPISPGRKILLMEEQFPSNYYIWERLAQEKGAMLEIVKAPDSRCRGQAWTQTVLDAITPGTAVVAMAHVHWADGTVFDLEAIGAKARSIGAALVIDGTQSVGALPFDIATIKPDALVCAGYKWLLGPYSIGLAYYGPLFDQGVPIEENWINRTDSHIFQNLAQYRTTYKPFAARFSMGEQSSFIHVPMMLTAIEQILAWGVDAIQEYCAVIAADAVAEMEALGAQMDLSKDRAAHLFGVRLGNAFDGSALQAAMAERRVFVSFRGDAIRVAPHVYNTKEDFGVLTECFRVARR